MKIPPASLPRVARRRLRLPLTELGRVSASARDTWIWWCGLPPCYGDTQRHQPQLTQDAAEQCLVEHLRGYHGATGGEVRAGRTRALERLAKRSDPHR